MRFSNNQIIDYYTTSQWLYKIFCYSPQSLGMHFGFWDKTTKNRQEAILNENNYLINIAGIKKGMKVLDAGCGVGGTSLDIAKKTGAKVWGITITPNQVELANKHAREKGLEGLVTFSEQDYTKTNFPDNFFDAVVATESVCYATPKIKFLKEAFRILKPTGKLVVADGYLARELKNKKETDIIEDFKWAFALSEFITHDEMLKQIKQAGFVKTNQRSMWKEVGLSVEYFIKLANLTKIFCNIAKFIPIGYIKAIYKNYVALKSTGEGYKLGLAGYYIHSGEKP